MFILTYRYLRKKYRERKARNDPQSRVQPNEVENSEGGPDTLPSGTSPPDKPSNRAQIMWRIMLLAGLALPVFLETLDYTVVATAQTKIASQFHHLDLQSYIGTVYLLTSTVFLPLFASFADIFGRHWTLQLALLLFAVGSAISTGSNNMATMLVGRGIAGIGAAGMLAAVRIILADSTSLDDNNWQQSMLFLLYTIGYCLGPVIGGALLTISFRWIFGINLPVAVAGMVVAFFLLRGILKGSVLREEITPSGENYKLPFAVRLLKVDWIGAGLFMAGGILILLALNWGSTERWDQAKVIASWVVGGILFIAFVVWEFVLEAKSESTTTKPSRWFPDPMIPVSLFRSWDVCIVQYATFVSGVILLVMFYFVAIFATIVGGYDSTKAGVQLIFFAPGLGGGSTLAILMVKTLRQPKYPAILGGVIQTVALGLISWSMTKNSQSMVNGFMAMTGVGVGLSIGPLAIHARFSQAEELVAVVSALTLFFRSFGGTVGLAQCGAVLNAKVNHYIANAISTGQISSNDVLSLSSHSSALTDLGSLGAINSLPGPVQIVIREAFRQGLRWCFISLIPWSGISAIATLFLSHIKERSPPQAKSKSQEPKLEVISQEKDSQQPANLSLS